MATRQTSDFPAGGVLTDVMLDNEFNEIFTNITDSNIAAGANIAISKTALGTFTDWTPYSPTWGNTGTANSIGNGVLLGQYTQLGKVVTAQIDLVWGSTTSSGSGLWNFSLPVTSASSAYFVVTWWGRDTGSSDHVGTGYGASTTTFNLVHEGNTLGSFNSSTPWTWANTDILRIQVTYKAA